MLPGICLGDISAAVDYLAKDQEAGWYCFGTDMAGQHTLLQTLPDLGVESCKQGEGIGVADFQIATSRPHALQ